MIEVYFWPTGNGRKITVMLEERSLPYDMIPVSINKAEHLTPEYDAINPDKQLARGAYLAGEHSIAAIATRPWVVRHA